LKNTDEQRQDKIISNFIDNKFFGPVKTKEENLRSTRGIHKIAIFCYEKFGMK
jgi:hypothetical protein